MSTEQMITVPCRFCGVATHMLGTSLCDRCWELSRRMQDDPELAAKILAEINHVD